MMPEPKRPPLKDWLKSMDACSRAMRWVGNRTLGEAWKQCPKSPRPLFLGDIIIPWEWLSWLADQCDWERGVFDYSAEYLDDDVFVDERRPRIPPLVTDAWDAYCYARWMADHA